jgi:hypothetical protein
VVAAHVNYSGAERLTDAIRGNLTQRPVRTRLPALRRVPQGLESRVGRGCSYERTRGERDATAGTNIRVDYPEPFTCWAIILRLATQAWEMAGGGVMKLGFSGVGETRSQFAAYLV